MGNCMRCEESLSSENWGGEDWGYQAEDGRDPKRIRKTTKEDECEEEEGLLLGGEENGFGSLKMKGEIERGGGAREVKIKMTKKQLEEMMGRVEMKQMSVQQVLAELIMSVSSSGADPYEGDDHQRPWRPVLQSIPEVN